LALVIGPRLGVVEALLDALDCNGVLDIPCARACFGARNEKALQ
jgi:hypothetical protein